jgi:hypothetical protein
MIAEAISIYFWMGIGMTAVEFLLPNSLLNYVIQLWHIESKKPSHIALLGIVPILGILWPLIILVELRVHLFHQGNHASLQKKVEDQRQSRR